MMILFVSYDVLYEGDLYKIDMIWEWDYGIYKFSSKLVFAV